MLKSLLRILLLVVLIAIPLALGFLYYSHTVLPDPGTRIEATPPKPWSDEKILPLYAPPKPESPQPAEPAVVPQAPPEPKSDFGRAQVARSNRTGRSKEALDPKAEKEQRIYTIKGWIYAENVGKKYRQMFVPGRFDPADPLVDSIFQAFKDSAQQYDQIADWDPDSAAYIKKGVAITSHGMLNVDPPGEPGNETSPFSLTNSVFYYQPDYVSDWCRVWHFARGFPDSIPLFLGQARIQEIKECDFSHYPLLGLYIQPVRWITHGFRALHFVQSKVPNPDSWRVLYRGREIGACRVEIDSGIVGDLEFIDVDPDQMINVEQISSWAGGYQHRPSLLLGDANTKPVAWTHENIIDFAGLFDTLNAQAGFDYTSDRFGHQLELQRQENPDSFSYNIVNRFSHVDGESRGYRGELHFPYAEVHGYNLEDGTVLYLINILENEYAGRRGMITINYLFYDDGQNIIFLRKSYSDGNILYARFLLIDTVDTIDPPNRFFVLNLSSYNLDGYITYDLNNMVELRDLWGYH